MRIQEVLQLLEKFPQIKLGVDKTPIQRLRKTETELGFSPIYIKRDDLNGLGIGGNKVRNLEFLLGDALSRECDTIIVSGQIQSNLCTLAAAACRYANLECVIVHNNEKPAELCGNAVLNKILNPTINYIGDVGEDARNKYVADLENTLRAEGKKPFVILNGASTATGSLGYVKGACELLAQISDERLNIKNVCVPGGNGGLAAGIVFGTALLGNPYHIDLITVEHTQEALEAIMRNFIYGLEMLTGVKMPCPLEEVMTIHSAYRFGGWGIAPKEIEDFICNFAQSEGIFVEKVYTAKVLYGMLDMINRGIFNDGVCYLHSGGTGALFSQF